LNKWRRERWGVKRIMRGLKKLKLWCRCVGKEVNCMVKEERGSDYEQFEFDDFDVQLLPLEKK
jgi:hypothetical protein